MIEIGWFILYQSHMLDQVNKAFFFIETTFFFEKLKFHKILKNCNFFILSANHLDFFYNYSYYKKI